MLVINKIKTEKRLKETRERYGELKNVRENEWREWKKQKMKKSWHTMQSIRETMA